jgi:acyl carrier protein
VDVRRPSRKSRGAAEDAATRSIEAVIRRFLAGYRPGGRGRARLSGTANLWNEVNSLTMLQLVAFVENRFAIEVRPIDFAPQNFSSVAAIARFVAARRPPIAATVASGAVKAADDP